MFLFTCFFPVINRISSPSFNRSSRDVMKITMRDPNDALIPTTQKVLAALDASERVRKRGRGRGTEELFWRLESSFLAFDTLDRITPTMGTPTDIINVQNVLHLILPPPLLSASPPRLFPPLPPFSSPAFLSASCRFVDVRIVEQRSMERGFQTGQHGLCDVLTERRRRVRGDDE